MGTNFSRWKRACAVLLLFVGTVAISPAQTLTTLANFTWTNGARPLYGSLVQGTDGNFYGTTELGGANDGGTVFKITPGGALTTLHSFSGETGSPEAGVIQATDGNFYGTTAQGGPSNQGTIFKITPGGALTTLYSFSGSSAALMQASDGNFYGISSVTVFKITPGGVLTNLHSPDGTTGSFHGGLIQATDGNLYGTTFEGGASGFGTVYKITLGGAATTLHSFDGAEGATPVAGLIQAADGSFYGTTSGGGANGIGTVFTVTPGGTLTTLHSFSGADGRSPQAGLIQAADGNLYGTTSDGGSNGYGTVFRLQLPAASQLPAIRLVQNAEGGSATIAPNTWVAIKGSNLAPAGDTRIWLGSDFVNNQMPTQLDGVGVTMNGENVYMYYISPAQLNVLTPPDLVPGPVQVTVTTGGVSASFTAQAQPESPSFFIFGAGPYVIGTHLDGTLIGPTSLYPGQSTPAHPGEVVILYANGFGAISPPVAAGSEVQSGSLPALPLIQIGGMPAVVQFAGLVSPGLYQFNIVVPSSAPAGDDAITATYSRSSTQAGAMLTVQP